MMQLLKARQRLSFVLAFALLFGVFLSVQKDNVYAAHVPQDYIYGYTAQNLYDSSVLCYDFTSLDATQTYTFTLQAMDLTTGFSSINLHSQFVGPGVVVATICYGEFLNSWPTGSHFPIRVVDNFGQILGEHFVTPIYTTGDWDVSQTVLVDDKQGIGGALYNPVNGFGYQHDSSVVTTPVPTYITHEGGYHLEFSHLKNSIITRVGDTILLHYQRETPFVETTDKIQIKDVGTGVLLAEFVLSELDCFSKFDPGVVFGENRFTYIALSTDGILDNWQDEGRINTCFSSSTNPSTLTVPPSAYSYGRVTTVDVLKDEGESVWLVTDDPNGQEWSITPREEIVRDGRDQRLDRRQATEALHDGFPIQEISDDTPAVIDATNYDFAPFRSGFYTPTPFTNPVTVTWEFESSDLLFGQTATEFPLFVAETFGMIIGAAPTSRTETLLNAIGDFNLDTDFGSLVILILATFIAFGGAFALKAPPLLYIVLYLVLVGTMIFLGVFSPEMTILIGISAFAAIMLMFLSPELLGKDRDGL